jgi:hypothetical protein
VYGNLSWKERLGKSWKMTLGLSYSNNEDKILNQLQDNNNSKQEIMTLPYSAKNFNIKANAQMAVAKRFSNAG